MHRFKIPLKAISVNQAYKIARNRMILSEVGREFKENCSDFFREQFLEEKPLECKLKVKILCQYRDNRKKIDVDNAFKLLIDSMKGIVFDDDSQIYELAGKKEVCMDRNEIHILVEEI